HRHPRAPVAQRLELARFDGRLVREHEMALRPVVAGELEALLLDEGDVAARGPHDRAPRTMGGSRGARGSATIGARRSLPRRASRATQAAASRTRRAAATGGPART